MTEKKKGRARASKKAPPPESIEQAEATPAPEGGPEQVLLLSGGSPHYDAVYQEGRDALAHLSSGREYEDWMKVAVAVSQARSEAMEAAETNQAWGRTYNITFGAILEREDLGPDYLDSKTRGQLFKLIEHEAEIEAWRESLSFIQRAELNHPSSVLRNWSKSKSPPKQKQKQRNAVVDLRHANAELSAEVEEHKARVKEVEEERGFDRPVVLLSALIKLGELDLDDLMSTPIEFDQSDLVKLAEQIKQLAVQWKQKVAA